jgi:hypothetical protein
MAASSIASRPNLPGLVATRNTLGDPGRRHILDPGSSRAGRFARLNRA